MEKNPRKTLTSEWKIIYNMKGYGVNTTIKLDKGVGYDRKSMRLHAARPGCRACGGRGRGVPRLA
jgi:hypothetical protein